MKFLTLVFSNLNISLQPSLKNLILLTVPHSLSNILSFKIVTFVLTDEGGTPTLTWRSWRKR